MAAPQEMSGGVEQAPLEVVITGGAGQIGYQLAPLVASGETFGDQSVNVRLLELPQAQQAAEGVAAELQDGAYAQLTGVDIYDDPNKAFDGATHVFMVGAKPRGKGMDRADLLKENGGIFKIQGAALEEADDDVKVLVVGNPANSNALVVASHAPAELSEGGQITAMSRLDHNRAVGLAAATLGVSADLIQGVIIWGNHSNSMVVDTTLAKVEDARLDLALMRAGMGMNRFAEQVKNRGAEVIALRGASSAMSAARAASDHMRDWNKSSNPFDISSWTSAAVLSRGEYGLPEGVFASMPVISATEKGRFIVTEGLEYATTNNVIRDGIQATGQELVEEREALAAAGFLTK